MSAADIEQVTLRNGQTLTMRRSTFLGEPCLEGKLESGRTHRLDPATGHMFCAKMASWGRAVVLKRPNGFSRADDKRLRELERDGPPRMKQRK